MDRRVYCGKFYSEIIDHLTKFVAWPCDELSQTKRPLVRIYSEKKYCCIINDKLRIFNSKYADSWWRLWSVLWDILMLVSLMFSINPTIQKEVKGQKWITPSLKISIKHKDRLYRKRLNNPNDSNILKYKQYKNRLHVCLKRQWRCIITKHLIRNQTRCYKCGSLWEIFLIRVEKQNHMTSKKYYMKTGKYTANSK